MAYSSKLKDLFIDDLFQAIILLENEEECYRFFEDICTISELKAIAQRLQVAKMLRDNRKYSDIAAETGASTATISRVKRSLNYGADGYNILLDRMDKIKK